MVIRRVLYEVTPNFDAFSIPNVASPTMSAPTSAVWCGSDTVPHLSLRICWRRVFSIQYNFNLCASARIQEQIHIYIYEPFLFLHHISICFAGHRRAASFAHVQTPAQTAVAAAIFLSVCFDLSFVQSFVRGDLGLVFLPVFPYRFLA